MMFKQAIRSGPLSGHVAIAKFHGLRDGCFLKMGDPQKIMGFNSDMVYSKFGCFRGPSLHNDTEDALHAAAFKDLMQIMDTIHVDQKPASLHGMATTKLKKTVLNLRHAHGG